MLEDKADTEFFSCMDRLESLVEKYAALSSILLSLCHRCTEAARSHSHATLFLNATIKNVLEEFTAVVRRQADDLLGPGEIVNVRYVPSSLSSTVLSSRLTLC